MKRIKVQLGFEDIISWENVCPKFQEQVREGKHSKNGKKAKSTLEAEATHPGYGSRALHMLF